MGTVVFGGGGGPVVVAAGFGMVVVAAAVVAIVAAGTDAVTGGGALAIAVVAALADGVGEGVAESVGVLEGVAVSEGDWEVIDGVRGRIEELVPRGAGAALGGAIAMPAVPSAKPETTRRTAPPRVLVPNQVFGRFHRTRREAPVATGTQPNAHTAIPKDARANNRNTAPAPTRPDQSCHPLRTVYIRS